MAVLASAGSLSNLLVNIGAVCFSQAVTAGQTSGKQGRACAEHLAEAGKTFGPQNSRAYSLIGAQSVQSRNSERAVANLQIAGTLDPRDAVSRFRLGEVLFERHEQDAALVEWRAAAAAPSFLLRGIEAAESGDPERAVDLAKTALAIDSEDYRAWLLLGDSLRSCTDATAAADAYGQAIQRSPSQASGYELLGQLYYKDLKRPEEADAILSRGITHADPPVDRLYAARSRLNLERERLQAAERDARVAVDLNPATIAHQQWLGDVLFARGSYRQAEEQYRTLGSIGQHWYWKWISHVRLAKVYVAQERREAAIAELRSAVLVVLNGRAGADTVIQGYVALGDLLVAAGRSDEARAAFLEALKLRPTDVAVSRRLASLQPDRRPR